MATGKETFMGLAVPLFGESEITQKNAANDILTVTGASGQTGSFLVAMDNSGAKHFGVNAQGGVQLKIWTTKPTTGMTKGELYLLFHGSTPKLGVCISTAGQKIKMIRLKTKTFGRLTA